MVCMDCQYFQFTGVAIEREQGSAIEAMSCKALVFAAAVLALVSGAAALVSGTGALRPTTALVRSCSQPLVAPLRMSDASDVLADLEALDNAMSDDKEDSDLEPRQPYLNRLAMQAARREWQRSENDSGSAEVQVAIMTERIIYLTKHLQTHPKDFHSRRGLIALVNNRRSQLNYLFENEPQRCLDLCASLGIRFKPRSAVQSREQKYSSFKNTKSKIGMLRAAALQTRALQQRSKEAQAN
ncbi:hypothetical protein JKP88DRAFT_232846 [Tribonema minus]|uniref:30S ribosomal protein S15 n=1 Tax=Tribonema minus TaxID=303371 RepID=A0A835ZJ48_9STRA|nr:hypothetical protein JKP88DRAFT_232846 [Tribonema minus]